jgi:RimJ/RimL family protein N-acetyltransferase
MERVEVRGKKLEVRDILARPVKPEAKALPVLQGETVQLRPILEDDLPLLVRWMNNPDVRYWLHHSERRDATVETVRGRFGLTEDAFPNLVWIIETLRVLPNDPAHSGQAEGRAVGHVGLLQVDPVHSRAELAISIGEKDCWSHGYGSDAIRAVLRHGFGSMELRRIELHTDADNARGIRCYEKCGFVREGVMRERRLRFGKPLDMVLMSVLRGEWEGQEELRGKR